MKLSGCVGTRAHDALLRALEEAVKENSLSRLETLLQENHAGSEEINHKFLLHQAAWLGHTRCVKLLLQYGGNPDRFHKKNGCTPLHLAHFRTIEETDPEETIRALLAAGADINSRGNEKCDRPPIDYAITFQRLDSVRALLSFGALASARSVRLAIDVSNPQILHGLLLAGANCGPMLENLRYWSDPLAQVIYTPLKSPKESYKQLFKMVVQATVCRPMANISSADKEHKKQMAAIENELRTIGKESMELTRYLYVLLVRNGLQLTESLRRYGKALSEPDWMDSYLSEVVPLKDLCVRVVRTHLYRCGNILYGASRLKLPGTIHAHVLLTNPF